MPRKPGKNSPRLYFTQETEDAIILYNSSTNQAERDRVYKDKIHKPFDKLAENLIHTFKFYYFDIPYKDVKHEVVAFLNEKISKYKQENGKAFSYFSIVAKNYLIIQNNKNYAKLKSHGDLASVDKNRNIMNEIIKQEMREQKKEFFDLFIEYWDKNLAKKFPKTRDRYIADAVIDLFRYRHNIENYNKKALYILIRERTGVKTQHVTKVINIIKQRYVELYEVYLRSGKLPNS